MTSISTKICSVAAGAILAVSTHFAAAYPAYPMPQFPRLQIAAASLYPAYPHAPVS